MQRLITITTYVCCNCIRGDAPSQIADFQEGAVFQEGESDIGLFGLEIVMR